MFTDYKLKEYNDREERFKLAIQEAHTNKTASINSIANKYKVSRTTLSRRIHGFKNTRTSHEKQQKFTNEEELLIIESIKNLLKNQPQVPSKKEILLICEDLLKSKYTNEPPNESENFFKVGKNWIDRFLERHNDKLMINGNTSLCEYYKYEFLQRKKLRSNSEAKTEESSPSLDDVPINNQQHGHQHHHHHHHQQQQPPRPMIPPSSDYIYPSNSNSGNVEQVAMNIPNGFVIPNLMPQTSFNQDGSNTGWNTGVNSVPMKHSTTAGYSQSNQSLNFQFTQPPQQQLQQQLQQPQLSRNISSLSGFGPNSILNNHGVHLNGNAVVNIYPETNGPMPPSQTTPTGASNFVSQYGGGLNTYALQQQQQSPPASAQQQTPQQQQVDTKPKINNSLDIMEFFDGQRFLYDTVRVRILTELHKPVVDTSLISKLVNLSFEQFEKDLQGNNSQGYNIPSYQ